MQLPAKRFLTSIILIFAFLGNLPAQENKYSFTWLDRNEKMLAGTLVCNLIPQTGDGAYQLTFAVTWFNADGKQILDVNQMPFLSLSKYDLVREPSQYVRCTSFEQKKPASLGFQVAERLNIQILNSYEGEIRLNARFQYALSKADYESGKLDAISVKGSPEVRMAFTVRSNRPAVDLTGNGRKSDVAASVNPVAQRKASENYRKLRYRFSEFESKASPAEYRKPDYLKSLDALSENIDSERMALNPDSLPADTLQLYRELLSKLNIKVLDFRSEVLKSILARNENAGSDSQLAGQRINDSLRNLIRSRFEVVINRQNDSLNLLLSGQKSLSGEISSILADTKHRRKTAARLDSLIAAHDGVIRELTSLRQSHDNAWNSYRIALGSLLPVSEIENAHASFIASRNDLQEAIDLTGKALAAVRPDKSATPWYLSNIVLWIGLFLVLVLVLVSAFWNTSRSRKIIEAGLASPEPSNGNGQPAKVQGTGIFAGELADEYFTLDYQETIPESAVGIVHLHPASIKSVYHLIQAALLEKRAGDFGGYLFGSQYRMHGKNSSRSELFVEKICESKYLRSTIANEIDARTDLVEELEGFLGENKKLRLIGWFTSSQDASIEVPEGLMKVHRSFFKEKWQIGILLNPGSDTLQGAAFLRRKTGYLDPLPDPAAFLKWDDLYRFALNPATGSKAEPDGAIGEGKDYARIEINNTWGDSIVTSVNFDRQVMAEINSAAANQAIPKDTYQVVGFLYGKVGNRPLADGKPDEYDLYVHRFIEVTNELAPRDLPGLSLVGWWGQGNVDVMTYLHSAVAYHEKTFREAYQFATLVNPATGEVRVFTRKHSLEMNNSTIETEEYQLNSLLSR